MSELRKLTHIEAIRLLSGVFNPDQAVNILAFINLISRNSLGDAENSFTDDQLLKIGIQLKREDK